MRNKYVAEHVMKRDDMFYNVRHIPRDLNEHYRVKKLCFSLKTRSLAYAIRFKRMDVPLIGTVRKDNGQSNDSPTILNELN